MIIGIGYCQSMRDQYLSVKPPFKLAFVTSNPLTVIIKPDIYKFKFFDKRNKKETCASPAIICDFIRALLTENFGYPCRVHSVNVLEDGVLVNHSLSD